MGAKNEGLADCAQQASSHVRVLNFFSKTFFPLHQTLAYTLEKRTDRSVGNALSQEDVAIRLAHAFNEVLGHFLDPCMLTYRQLPKQIGIGRVAQRGSVEPPLW